MSTEVQERKAQVHLTDEQFQEAKKLLEDGMTVREVAKKFGVSLATIYRMNRPEKDNGSEKETPEERDTKPSLKKLSKEFAKELRKEAEEKFQQSEKLQEESENLKEVANEVDRLN